MVGYKTTLEKTRVVSLTISKAALAREADIDIKTYTAIENGSKQGRDVTREAIRKAVNRLLTPKKIKPLSIEELFP